MKEDGRRPLFSRPDVTRRKELGMNLHAVRGREDDLLRLDEFVGGKIRWNRAGRQVAGFGASQNDSGTSGISGVRAQESNGFSYLVGLRYLTSVNLTLLCEFYHDDAGMTESEFVNHFNFLRHNYQSGDD